jgi:hypothetical protein
LDTYLGEASDAHFIIPSQNIHSETLLNKDAFEAWWISRNDKVSLIGSMTVPAGLEVKAGEGGASQAASRWGADSIMFANWKRLHDVPWRITYQAERNFNFLPYSVKDSAVCYYFDSRPLGREETRIYTVFLAAGDERGFIPPFAGLSGELARIVSETVTVPEASATTVTVEDSNANNAREKDLAILRELIAKIDDYMASGAAITEEELAAIQLVINSIKARHGL